MNRTATILDRTKSSTIDTLFLIGLAFIIAEILSYFEDVSTALKTILFTSLVLYEPICATFWSNNWKSHHENKNSQKLKRIQKTKHNPINTSFFLKNDFWMGFLC